MLEEGRIEERKEKRENEKWTYNRGMKVKMQNWKKNETRLKKENNTKKLQNSFKLVVPTELFNILLHLITENEGKYS